MATLGTMAGQMLDKLSDLVNAGCRGVVSCQAYIGVVTVEQGQLGNLADGRLVRVTRTMKVTAGYTTSVPVRLYYLAPSVNGVGNFQAVADGTLVTWIAPPTDLHPTAPTDGTFAKHSGYLEDGVTPIASVGAVVEHHVLTSPAEMFVAGQQGASALIVQSPTVKRMSAGNSAAEGSYHRQYFDVTWKIRYNQASMSHQKDRRQAVRNVFDALCASIQGATIGDTEAHIESWNLIKGTTDVESWELVCGSRLAGVGRVLREHNQIYPALLEFGMNVQIPGHALQDPSHVVSATIDPTSGAFSDGFDEGFDGGYDDEELV